MILTPMLLGLLVMIVMMKAPAVRYISSEMAATIGVATMIGLYYLQPWLQLPCLEQLLAR